MRCMKEKLNFLTYTRFGLILISIALLFSTNVQPSIANEKEMVSELDAYLKSEPGLRGALAGISVRELQSGGLLYDHNGDIRLRPASNLKLLTAAAALNVLGEQHRFKTELYTDGRVENSILKGNLYIKGKGDPTLVPKDFEKVVSNLKNKGISKIKGNIYGDDSWYDDVRYSQDLPWSDEQEYYGAQVSALTASPDQDYDAGTVIVEIIAAEKEKDKARITLYPETNYVQIINKTKTVARNGSMDLTYSREHGTNNIIIEGTIPLDAMEKEWIAVWAPTNYATTLFAEVMQKHGISFTGKIDRRKTPNNAILLAEHESEPLSELLHPFMKLSNNGHAEILVKEMGRLVKNEGSWEKGLAVMEEQLTALGIQTSSLVLRDGSGISHVNLIPANEITKLLYQAQKQEWYSSFLSALPVSGIEERMVGGTLRYRMNTPPLKGNVRAKTGTISTVSSLSGYVETVGGKTFVFSILLNNLMDEDDGKRIEDNIINILAN